MAGVLRIDFRWPEGRIQNAVKIVARVAGKGIVIPHTKVQAVTADPDDNSILECPVDGKADLIVSNDHHLLDLKEFAGIPKSAPSFCERSIASSLSKPGSCKADWVTRGSEDAD
jgi:predicted nucleic acid-binding protein